MARSRGRHVAPRSTRPGLAIGIAVSVFAVGVLAVGGLFSGVLSGLTGGASAATGSDRSTSVSSGTTGGSTPTPTPSRSAAPTTAGGASSGSGGTPSTVSPLTHDDPIVPLTQPAQCPEGTVPGVVDVYGNESNCQAISSTP